MNNSSPFDDSYTAVGCIDCGKLVSVSPTTRTCIMCGGYLCDECAEETPLQLDIQTAHIRHVCESCYKRIQPDDYLWEQQELPTIG